MMRIYTIALCVFLAAGCTVKVQTAKMEDGDQKEKFSVKGKVLRILDVGVKDTTLYIGREF